MGGQAARPVRLSTGAQRMGRGGARGTLAPKGFQLAGRRLESGLLQRGLTGAQHALCAMGDLRLVEGVQGSQAL